jgi:hypothetical protein
MGQAKLKAKRQRDAEVLSQPLTRARFDLYALGTRSSYTNLHTEELTFWSDPEEQILALVVRDTVDQDYGYILLARDKIGRFRCVALEVSFSNEQVATQRARAGLAKLLLQGDIVALGHQGDETNYATDVLSVPPAVDRETLHPFFRQLSESSGRHPARSVLREIGPWLAPSDPHFVSEFQFKQFDQRLWEMYLWAAFRELRFDVTQPEAPDFLCQGPGFAFTAEATTVGPSASGVLADHPDPRTPDEMEDFLNHYMPMKFGSSLTSKLAKTDKQGRNYWERGDASNRPFVLAVADFHIPGGRDEIGSMTYSHSALWPYLYGHRVEWVMRDGQLVVHAVRGEDHTYRGKVVETGFFDLPGAENISAVLFSNAGTLGKFDRMGIVAGFAPEDHMYLRSGFRFDPDPAAVRPVAFTEEVGGANYTENWADELQLFHNPNATHPLPVEIFRGVTQHFFNGSKQVSIIPEGVVLSSFTMIINQSDQKKNIELNTTPSAPISK